MIILFALVVTLPVVSVNVPLTVSFERRVIPVELFILRLLNVEPFIVCGLAPFISTVLVPGRNVPEFDQLPPICILMAFVAASSAPDVIVRLRDTLSAFVRNRAVSASVPCVTVKSWKGTLLFTLTLFAVPVLPDVMKNVPPVIGVPDKLILTSGNVVFPFGLAILTVPPVIENADALTSNMEFVAVLTVPPAGIANVPPLSVNEPPAVVACNLPLTLRDPPDCSNTPVDPISRRLAPVPIVMMPFVIFKSPLTIRDPLPPQLDVAPALFKKYPAVEPMVIGPPKGVIVDALDSLKVPFVNVRPLRIRAVSVDALPGLVDVALHVVPPSVDLCHVDDTFQ